MSSVANLGAQDLTWIYKEQAKAIDFNMLFRDIIPAGIYSGGIVAQVNATTVQIPVWSGIINTNDTLGAVKCTTGLSYNFVTFSGSLADGEYVIYGLLTWAETPNNFIGYYIRDILAASVTNELIFGTMTVVSNAITTVTPNRRMIGRFNDVQTKLDHLMSTQGWAYSESVGSGTSAYPQYIILSSGVHRIRQNITWASTSAQTKNPSVIVYQYSSDSGTIYVTIATKTYTYATDQLTAIAWS